VSLVALDGTLRFLLYLKMNGQLLQLDEH